MAKHTGTEYNAIQRMEAAIKAIHKAEQKLFVLEHAIKQGLHVSAQVKRNRTLHLRSLQATRQRLSLACTYWLQHQPLKD